MAVEDLIDEGLIVVPVVVLFLGAEFDLALFVHRPHYDFILHHVLPGEVCHLGNLRPLELEPQRLQINMDLIERFLDILKRVDD